MVRFLVMDTTPPTHQGRTRGLYDEQLQRQCQEKWLFRQAATPARAVVPVREEEAQP